MSILKTFIEAANTIAIIGHVHPDGDCAGSCLAAYHYIKEHFENKEVTVYLEPLSKKFAYLDGFDQINHDSHSKKIYDLCICLDSSDKERLGEFAVYLDGAKESICIDHHITNTRYAKVNVVEDYASSTCEVLYHQLEEGKISKTVAECIYTGIIHDTGVFKHSNTSQRTMEVAGKLMGLGIDFGTMIDEGFYKKTYLQTQIMGRALLESINFLHGTCIFSAIQKRDMDFFEVDSKDLDGIVDQLRSIDGIECAVFLYEIENHVYKVSMRSNSYVDVSKIASFFGGGGHIRAAGCTMAGSIHDVINNLSRHIEAQMDQQEK